MRAGCLYEIQSVTSRAAICIPTFCTCADVGPNNLHVATIVPND